MTRLPVDVFDLPETELRCGYRSATYFNRTRQIMRVAHPNRSVVMQVFQKNNAVLCGIDEAIAVLQVASGKFSDLGFADRYYVDYQRAKRREIADGYGQVTGALTKDEAYQAMRDAELALDCLWEPAGDQLQIEALHEGDEINPWEPVLRITGPYNLFAHLESVYLGVLARRTKVATNVRSVVEAAGGKPILMFADRFDHFATQGGDGYAAKIGGAQGVASDAMGAWWGEPGMGTMPHALIAAYSGDLIAACRDFRKHFPDVNLIGLVDFHNDCVRESLDLARYFKDDLWGVRLDTSETMVDASILQHPEQLGQIRPTGVNELLVRNVRSALDREGFTHVKIVVSGGFTAEKIRSFEANAVPADVYAVGSSLLQGSNDFTADIVLPVSKAGRVMQPADRLEVV